MTAYFDQTHEAISHLEKVAIDEDGQVVGDCKELDRIYKELDRIEETLVFDVTIALEEEGFPADLRVAGHDIILKHAVSCRPINDSTHPSVESFRDHVKEIHEMSSALHTLFHRACLDHRLSDDPRSFLQRVYCRGESYREEIVAKRAARRCKVIDGRGLTGEQWDAMDRATVSLAAEDHDEECPVRHGHSSTCVLSLTVCVPLTFEMPPGLRPEPP